MEFRVQDGQYVPAAAGGVETVSGAEETAVRITMKLTARRGGFPLLPDYGSRLYQLAQVKPSERESAVRGFVGEALMGETGVTLEDVSLSAGEAEDTIALGLTFSCEGQRLYIQTEV